MKIVVGYPPTFSEKGTLLLSQNRQLQWFNNPTFLYPVALGTGATWLRDKGHEVFWKDCIAEDISTQDFLDFLDLEKPDLFIFETKSPVIKKHWVVINELKQRVPWLKIGICGDHVSYKPKETMENSEVDYVFNGGYYDFAMVELVESLEKKEKIPAGVWYRENGSIIDNGRYNFKRSLDEAPYPDRILTKNQMYQKEFNLKGRPLAYIMSGRDCWWGKCTFCFHPDTDIFTDHGMIPIKDMAHNTQILTHKGTLKEKEDFFENYYSGNMIELNIGNIPKPIKCTPNHKFYGLKQGKILPELIAAENLEKGDYLIYPIFTEVKDIEYLDSYEVLKKNFVEIKTKTKTLSSETIDQIHLLHAQGTSQRAITKQLGIDREAVNNHLTRDDLGMIKLVVKDGKVQYTGANTSVPQNIPLTEEFMRLAGYYLAEGNVATDLKRPNSLVLQLTFAQEEQEYIQDVVDIQTKLFGIAPTLVPNSANHTIQATTYSNILGAFFRTLFKTGSEHKDIPQEFLALPHHKQQQLLAGLFKGDAHIRPYEKRPKEYILNTTSKNLAYKVWNILTRLSIIPSFYISPAETREKAKLDQYGLSICGSDIQKLGFVDSTYVLAHPDKVHRQVYIEENHVFLPIKTISAEEYMGHVFNMQVEDEHSYTAGLVAASNCVWDHTLYPKGTFRARTPENVIKEVKYLVDECGVKEIFDDAGTITVGPWLKKFCNLMIESGYNQKVMYSCNMRFGAVNLEEYKLMKKAGFRLLKYGLESGVQKTIDKLDKGTKIEEIIPSCRDAKKAGLTVHLTMMVGYPWETKKDAVETLKLAKKLMHKGYADVLQSTVVMPYPGTPLYAEAVKEGWLLIEPTDYERLDMTEPILKTPHVSREEIMKVCDSIYTEIFFHPKYVYQHLKKIKSWDDVKYTLRGVKAVLGHVKDFSRPVDTHVPVN